MRVTAYSGDSFYSYSSGVPLGNSQAVRRSVSIVVCTYSTSVARRQTSCAVSIIGTRILVLLAVRMFSDLLRNLKCIKTG
jgi:hypothetical protein